MELHLSLASYVQEIVLLLFLRDDSIKDLTYGSSKYDYDEDTLIYVAPGQVGGVEYNGNVFRVEGWTSLFHPHLLRSTSLDSKIRDFSFFSYQVHEALHMTSEKRKIFVSLLKQIFQELDRSKDQYHNSILLSYIELVLNHCMRFYDRQFATRRMDNSDILSRFEKLLFSYYDSRNN